MALLTRDQILQQKALPSEDVPVPEWGGSVRVKTLRGDERDAWEGSLIVRSGKKSTVETVGARAKLVAASVVDEDDRLLFTEEDVVALGQLSSAALSRVYDVAARLSGVTEEDIEELGKASRPGPAAASPSA